jgi:hypothetical protein
MKKIFYYTGAIIILTSCKSNSNKRFNGSTTTKSNTAVLEANRVIDYTNIVSEVVEKYTNAAADAIKDYDETNQKWTNNEDVIGVFSTDMDFLGNEKNKATIAFAAPVQELKDDITFFKDSVGLYKDLFRQFKENDSTLKFYITAKDFKDDKYAKGKDLLNKQFEIYPQLARLYNSINKKIEKVAEAAEAVSQQDSPLKNAYSACKGDLNKMKSLVDFIIKKQEGFTEQDIVEIDKMYATFTNSIEQNKVANKADVEKANKTIQYNMFYDRITSESAAVKSIIRNIKSVKKLTENDYTLIDASYTNAVTVYNVWIQ